MIRGTALIRRWAEEGSVIFVTTPARLDYAVIAGQTFSESFVISLDGQPVNLAGLAVRWQGKRLPTDRELTINMSTTNGKIVVDAVAGRVTCTEVPANTRLWYFGNISTQCEIEDIATGQVTPLFVAEFAVAHELAQ